MPQPKETPPLPRFKTDFDLGWVGFVRGSNLVSRAINYLTRWDRKGSIIVSHAFLITGKDQCVEANMPDGVVTNSLAKEYLGKKDLPLYFRKPRQLTPWVARKIVKRAKAQVGAKFDYGVLVSEGLTGTFLGHLVNTVCLGEPQILLDKLLNEKNGWVCSELIAFCFQAEPRYRNKGVLADPPGTIDPQKLFEDDELFEALAEPQPTPNKKRR